MANMPIGAAGVFVAMMAAATLHARTSRRGLVSGVTLGALLGAFAIGSSVLVNYATLNMSASHAGLMSAAALGEWLLVGAVIDLVYGPVPASGG